MTIRELFRLIKADLSRLSVQGVGGRVKVQWINLLNPRVTPVLIIRFARFLYLSKWFTFLSPIPTWINVVLFGIEVTPRCEIGPGLMLPHTSGTVIGAWCIGSNVTIFQGVTLGAKEIDLDYQESTRPIVGDGVNIGAGAKILGRLTLGDCSRVGANAVVLSDVAPGSLAVGVPAKVTRIDAR